MKKEITIDLANALALYKSGGLAKAIIEKEFKDYNLQTLAELPDTWDEFCESTAIKPDECFIGSTSDIICMPEWSGLMRNADCNRNMLPNGQIASAFIKLMQLLQLRDAYRNRWVPVYGEKKNYKYIISCSGNELVFDEGHEEQSIFSFQSEEIRELFYTNFRTMLESVKTLLL